MRWLHKLRRTLPSPIFYLQGNRRRSDHVHYDGPEWQCGTERVIAL
jgi:hypothetical protein